MTQAYDAVPPVLTGSRQTMASWAKVIESYEELPSAYQPTCAELFSKGKTFPTCILSPASRELSRRISEKLLCITADLLTVLERDKNQMRVQQYHLPTLRDVELGTILLYSWITISGVTQQGEFATTTFAFNTATLRHFTPLLEKARGIPAETAPTDRRAEQAKLDYLAQHDFKFMNYAKNSLHPAATVLTSLWQPEIRTQVFGFLRWTLYRTLATRHLIVLSDREFILIRDDPRIRSVRGARHGGVWHFIPRRSIVQAEITTSTDELLLLTLQLTNKGQLEMLFTPDQGPALAELQKKLAP